MNSKYTSLTLVTELRYIMKDWHAMLKNSCSIKTEIELEAEYVQRIREAINQEKEWHGIMNENWEDK